MKIALDYDGTFTADPELWINFIDNAKKRGHQIFIVTMRYPNETLSHEIDCEIIYTSRKAKIRFLADLGLTVNIWVDDMPHLLFQGVDVI